MSVVIANTTQAYEAGPSLPTSGLPAPQPRVWPHGLSPCHSTVSQPKSPPEGPTWRSLGKAPSGQALARPHPSPALSSSSWGRNYHMNVASSRSRAGGAGEGTGSHPQGPPGSQLAAAGQLRGSHSQYRGRSLEVGRGLPVGRGGHAGSQQVWEAPRTGMRPQLSFSRWQLV